MQALRIVSRKWIGVPGGYPVEPVDLHPSVRHLDCLQDKLTLTDKVAHAYSLREQAEKARHSRHPRESGEKAGIQGPS